VRSSSFAAGAALASSRRLARLPSKPMPSRPPYDMAASAALGRPSWFHAWYWPCSPCQPGATKRASAPADDDAYGSLLPVANGASSTE